MSATIERRLAKLREEWIAFIHRHNEREARYYRALGASAAIPWQQWPPKLLALLADMKTDPAHIHGVLQAMAAEEDLGVIRIVWVDGGIDRLHNPPLLAVQPGYLDKLLPDDDQAPQDAPQPHEARTMPSARQNATQAPEPPPEPPYSFERARIETERLARRRPVWAQPRVKVRR